MKHGEAIASVYRFAEHIGLHLEDVQAERIDVFTRLLRERGVPLGLVSGSDAPRLLERHVLDSLRAAVVFSDADRRATDLGSGAGLPGLVLASALPGCGFLLVEPRRRAAAFLELAVDALGLSNVALEARAEGVTARADVVTVRAFAPIDRSWATAWPLLHPGGRVVYFAGKGLEYPEQTARGLSDPEPPASVRIVTALESHTPLVIMSRRG